MTSGNTSKLKICPALGDGHCLLHSLAPGCNVDQLRETIVEKLREEATINGEFGDLYSDEADWLEEDADLWGGQPSMLVFSKMRAVNVLVHDTLDLNQISYDNTHPEVDASAPEVHIAFNGRDHYDSVKVDIDNQVGTSVSSTCA